MTEGNKHISFQASQEPCIGPYIANIASPDPQTASPWVVRDEEQNKPRLLNCPYLTSGSDLSPQQVIDLSGQQILPGLAFRDTCTFRATHTPLDSLKKCIFR